jgi:anti-anti-sigma factor
MNVQSEEKGSTTRLIPAGKLDSFGAQAVEMHILRALRRGVKLLEVDLTQVSFLGSAGVRVIIQYYKQLKATEGKLVLLNPNSSVKTVLQLSGIDEAVSPTSES